MAAYKSRVLYEKFKHHLRPMSHYAMGHLPTWGRLVTKLHVGALGNLFTQTPGLRHVVRAMAGVDQRRPMPKFRKGASARKDAAREIARREPQGKPVAIWADSFSDAFEGNQLLGLVATLISAGYAPRMIEQDACCGLTWITTGQLDGAKAHLRKALDVLYPIAKAGTPIVGMEPSCMAVWRSDAGELLEGDERVAEVAHATHTGRTAGQDRRMQLRPVGPHDRRPAALPPVAWCSVGLPTRSCWNAPAPRWSPAVAAGWPATSVWRRAITR